jgi:hypothetical protein
VGAGPGRRLTRRRFTTRNTYSAVRLVVTVVSSVAG